MVRPEHNKKLPQSKKINDKCFTVTLGHKGMFGGFAGY
jgi:hypothetical protein